MRITQSIPAEASSPITDAYFDPALPTPKDYIRLALGDKHSGSEAGPVPDAFIQDTTINAILSSKGYVQALIELAQAMISEISRKPTDYAESGGINVSWKERIPVLQDLISRAQSGKISDPTKVRRSGPSVGRLTAQGSLPSGFRSD